jgi:predicted phosphoadenosine phosphosulfate sulfurtransferase
MGAKEKVSGYIRKWESRGYPNGIPDEAPIELERSGVVPSYKLICIALMKNPNNLEILGVQREKCKVYQEIKRHEIYHRPTKYKQLKLWL